MEGNKINKRNKKVIRKLKYNEMIDHLKMCNNEPKIKYKCPKCYFDDCEFNKEELINHLEKDCP